MRGMSPFSLGRQQGGRCQASVTSSPKEEKRDQREELQPSYQSPSGTLAKDARQRLGRTGRGLERSARWGGIRDLLT